MRAGASWCVANRLPDGEISVRCEKYRSLTERYFFFGLPIVRGTVSLFEMLFIGIEALSYSSNLALESEEEGSPLTKWEMAKTIAVSFAGAILIFLVAPYMLVRHMTSLAPDDLWFHVAEGFTRLLFFFLYVVLIARLEEIRRVFMYHGAEHKAVFCFEANAPLTVDNAASFSPHHPRCGTNFVFIVIMVSIVFFAFLRSPDILVQIGLKLVLVPVIAGVSYELLKIGARIRFLSFISWPGLLFQRFTAFEPEPGMIEVAIKALRAVAAGEAIPLAGEGVLDPVSAGWPAEEAR